MKRFLGMINSQGNSQELQKWYKGNFVKIITRLFPQMAPNHKHKK